MISSKLLSFLFLPFSSHFSAVEGIQVWGEQSFCKIFFPKSSSIYFQFGKITGHSPLSWRKFENPPPAAETVKGELKQDSGTIFFLVFGKHAVLNITLSQKRCQPDKGAGLPSARGLGRVGGGTGFDKKKAFFKQQGSIWQRLQPKCPLGWAKSGDGAQCFRFKIC